MMAGTFGVTSSAPKTPPTRAAELENLDFGFWSKKTGHFSIFSDSSTGVRCWQGSSMFHFNFKYHKFIYKA